MKQAAKFVEASLSLVLVFVAGCHKHDAAGSWQRETSHVRSLTNLYGEASAKLGHLPQDEQEFKHAIAALGVRPEKMGVTSLDELFISERDHKPLIVIYGSHRPQSDVVVYEQVGWEGKRWVGHRIGMVEEMDEAAFRQLRVAPQ